MSTIGYQEACDVEKLAEADLLPYLEKVWPKCEYYPTRHHFWIQKVCGDILLKRRRQAKYIEMKAEVRNEWQNIFVETWSNKSRRRMGWFHLCQADWLWYYFITDKELYILSVQELRDWARRRLFDFPEKRQRRYEQPNDTWGHPVPIAVFRDELPQFTGPINPLKAMA